MKTNETLSFAFKVQTNEIKQCVTKVFITRNTKHLNQFPQLHDTKDLLLLRPAILIKREKEINTDN